MKTNMVSCSPEGLLLLTEEQRAVLTTTHVDEVEHGDTHDMPVEQLKNAVNGRFYRPPKQQITARIDADVLDWLKSQGSGYQARMNAILRREMLSSMSSPKRI